MQERPHATSVKANVIPAFTSACVSPIPNQISFEKRREGKGKGNGLTTPKMTPKAIQECAVWSPSQRPVRWFGSSPR